MSGPNNFVLSQRSLEGGGEVVSLEGSTTPAAAERLGGQIDELIPRNRTVIIDLSRLSFVDSALVSTLGQCSARAKQRGTRLLIVEPIDPRIAAPLQSAALDDAEVLPTLDLAAKAMRRPPASVQSAIPPPPDPLPPLGKPRRTFFGRRAGDQEILRELAELRRITEQLQRGDGGSDSVDKRIQALEQQIEALRGQLAEATGEAERFKAEAERANAEADRMEAEAEAAHARIQELEARQEAPPGQR